MTHTALPRSFGRHNRAVGRLATKYNRELVNLPVVAEQVAAYYHEVADAKSICIVVDVAPDVLVIGDVAGLRRAVAQVVANVLEKAPPGGRVIISGETSNGIATLTVSDNGLCRMEEASSHIWNRFYQAKRTESPKALGAGQGLVDEIVKAHGGRTELTSQPHAGSRVVLRLPVGG